MKRESEDKAERILSMYSRLKEGKTIHKADESVAYGVAPRTIQRDIADIQNFLQNQQSETGEIQQVVFDKGAGGYRLETKVRKQLDSKECLAVCKVLLESRSLVRDEMFSIINKMLNACGESEEKRLLENFIGNEMEHFIELHHGKRLLHRLWELETAVERHNYIEIKYKKMKNSMQVIRKVKPVGGMFSEFYFYLTAFIEDIDKEKEFENPNDIFPTIYRVDRLEDVKVLKEHFSIPYSERFEEGEFRKRVQFMYGGKLRRVKFKYSGESIESVLDRLPMAEIVEEKDGVYTVSAEVFGKGVDMWLRSQGEKITDVLLR